MKWTCPIVRPCRSRLVKIRQANQVSTYLYIYDFRVRILDPRWQFNRLRRVTQEFTPAKSKGEMESKSSTLFASENVRFLHQLLFHPLKSLQLPLLLLLPKLLLPMPTQELLSVVIVPTFCFTLSYCCGDSCIDDFHLAGCHDHCCCVAVFIIILWSDFFLKKNSFVVYVYFFMLCSDRNHVENTKCACLVA